MWKDIEYLKGYEVSNDGKIRCRRFNRNLKGSLSNKGYIRVTIRKNTYALHRLIAEAFIPNPDNLPQVNHKDGNKLNNQIDNLEWCTQSKNMIHARENGLYSEYNNKLSNKIIGINISTNKTITFNSYNEAQRCGFNAGHICSCIKGNRKTHKKHKWYLMDR